MRIVTAGFHHESNTFNPIVTGREDFNIYRGKEIYRAVETYESVRGVVETLESFPGYEVVPTIFARAVPNGEIDPELYEELKAEMIRRMEGVRDADAVTLALHGSMRVKGLGEAEGDLLEAIRGLFPDIPIVAALDMHATVSERMLRFADAFCGYKQAPHTDCFETGALAARMTRTALESGRPLSMFCRRIPMLIAGEKSETGTSPMKELIEELRKSEEDPAVLAASYLLGFPWADCEDNGVSALVVTLDDPPRAEACADKLARRFWEERRNFRFHTESYPPAEALEAALRAEEQPVYLSDSGDNPTAGSSADCTGLLGIILDHPGVAALETPLLYGGIYDPEAVARCLAAGEGAALELRFGAAFDRRTTAPLTRRGTVAAIRKAWGDYGTDLVLFRCGNTEIVLVSKHIGFIAPDLFRALGVDPLERKIVTVKLGYLTAMHKEVAARAVMALSRGSSNEILENLPYRRVRRPLFPLDPETPFSL